MVSEATICSGLMDVLDAGMDDADVSNMCCLVEVCPLQLSFMSQLVTTCDVLEELMRILEVLPVPLRRRQDGTEAPHG